MGVGNVDAAPPVIEFNRDGASLLRVGNVFAGIYSHVVPFMQADAVERFNSVFG